MRLSVTARIALLSIALALASNFAVILFVWKQTHDDAIATVRRDTVEQAEDFREIWRSGGDRALAAAVMRARQPGDVTTIVALLDGEGRHVLGTGPARVDTVPIAPTTFRIAHIASSAPWSEHEAGYAVHRLGGYWLLNGSLLAVVEQEQRALESALAIAVLVSLILGVLGGLVLTRYVSARLVRIAGVVAAAGEGDLTRRVPLVAGGRDAFDRLAVRLNATLDRLERVMAELRVVTDSLAHDLRSPLARLRTKTEQAVLIADLAQREAALGGLLTETDLVMRMLTMVIEISRSEAVSRDRFTLVDPGELVEEIGELYEPVAEDQGVDLAVVLDVHPLPMMLHRELLSQAITNLIDNALKHAKGADVTLRLAAMADGLAIQVEDRGPGIAEADRAQALKRFGRLDSARTTPGAGLGMALIEAVARLHGGRFEMADNAPGLVARIVVPR